MKTWIAAFAALALAGTASALLQDPPQKGEGYDDTPLIPGQKWKVHDKERIVPPVVTPGATPGAPPSDAIILFDGKDLSKWHDGKGGDSKWKVEDGYVEVVPKTGGFVTREEFGDCQLHIEWRTPETPKGKSQGRSNSGVFFMGRYELQVLDSFENLTYADGQAGAMYGQWPPLVNASRKPGEWQTYDVAFTAPRYQDGAVVAPATITVFHNGVLLHNKQAYLGPSTHRNAPKYPGSHPAKGPISLQDHGDPMRFRNIWVRPLKGYDER